MNYNYQNTTPLPPEPGAAPEWDVGPGTAFITTPSLNYQYSDPRFKPQIFETPSKSDDEVWIEKFIGTVAENKPSPSVSTKKRGMKIHVAKSILHKCLQLLNELQKLQEYLHSNVATIPSAEWKQKSIEIGQQKDEFSLLLSQFESGNMLEQLQRTLKQRRRKRISQKRKRLAWKEERENNLNKRKELHKKIDKWRDHMKEEVEKVKQEEITKRDADCILSEVNKKKSDARKQITLINALLKLRTVREKAALARGEKVSLEDSSAFKHVTEKLLKMWENALKAYGVEEQELKSMLKDKEEKTSVDTLEQQSIEEQWENVLFGPKIIPNSAYWVMTAAEKDLITFIGFRKSWDTFLVSEEDPNGSKIPIGWVLPHTSTESNPWSQYLLQ